jgi:uncharacterized protein (DUF302 family)
MMRPVAKWREHRAHHTEALHEINDELRVLVCGVPPTVSDAVSNPISEPAREGRGIIERRSAHAVDETVAKITAILTAKGVKLFATIDHSGGAAEAGMRMPPTKLLIFGNPAAGTPLMRAAPSIALDLPLKLLVSERDDGSVWLSYNSAGYLAERHGLPSEMAKVLEAVDGIAAAAAR